MPKQAKTCRPGALRVAVVLHEAAGSKAAARRPRRAVGARAGPSRRRRAARLAGIGAAARSAGARAVAALRHFSYFVRSIGDASNAETSHR